MKAKEKKNEIIEDKSKKRSSLMSDRHERRRAAKIERIKERGMN